MRTTPISELLKLPPDARAELAMTLWDSLSTSEREAQLCLTPVQAAELDRRWEEHVRNPASSVPWADVLHKLRG